MVDGEPARSSPSYDKKNIRTAEYDPLLMEIPGDVPKKRGDGRRKNNPQKTIKRRRRRGETIYSSWDNVPGSQPMDDPKHEAYCMAMSKGISGGRSALIAGYPPKSAPIQSTRLKKKPEIEQRIAFLAAQTEHFGGNLNKIRKELFGEEKPSLLNGVTRRWLIWEFFCTMQMCRENHRFREANYALAYIAKLSGDLAEDQPMPEEYVYETVQPKYEGQRAVRRKIPEDTAYADDLAATGLQKKPEVTGEVGGTAGQQSETEGLATIQPPDSIDGPDEDESA